MKAENLGRLSLLVSVLPLTLFIIRHLKIGMEAPWVYIIFAVYALLIIAGFVFAIWLVKNKRTRTATSKCGVRLSGFILSWKGCMALDGRPVKPGGRFDVLRSLCPKRPCTGG